MKYFFGLIVFVLPMVYAQAATQNLDRRDILVFLKAQPDLRPAFLILEPNQRRKVMYMEMTKVARLSQQAVLAEIAQQGLTARSYYIANMILVENVDRAFADKLMHRNDVRKVVVNNIFRPGSLPRVSTRFEGPGRGIEPSLAAIKADQVWNDLKVLGQGVVVAGQDTGIQWNHPALVKQYRGTTLSRGNPHDYNWHDAIHKSTAGSRANVCGYDSKVPCDDHGHGTHTMGTILGDDGANNKIGVAPKAKWIGCRNMNNGLGSTASYMECFEFFFAPYPIGGNALIDGKAAYAPNVINNSWGCPADEGCHADELLPVIEKVHQSGILIVASAGNEGPGCGTIQAPPAYHSAATLSVGAVRNSGAIASFSSRGPSSFDKKPGPDVVAPGVGIRSSVPGNKYQGGWDGTSMAGPHVVGLVALMWSGNPKLMGQIDLTNQIIQASATPIDGQQTCGGIPGKSIPNNVTGYGMIDSMKAVKAAITGRLQ